MRWLPPIFLFGILLNAVLCLVFRLRVDRAAQERFELFRSAASSEIVSLTTNALHAIDAYFVSNRVASVSVSAFSSGSSSDVLEDYPILRNAGTWKYHYFELGNNRFARVGIRNYGEGDFFPRGGLITNIHPDGIVVDAKYWVSNSSVGSDFIRDDVNTSIPSLKELSK